MGSNYFPPMIEQFISECDETSHIDVQDVDKTADIAPLMQSLSTGIALPPELQPIIAKGGVRTDFSKDAPVVDDWQEVIAAPAEKVEKAARTWARDKSDEERELDDRLDKAYCALTEAGIAPEVARAKIYG